MRTTVLSLLLLLPIFTAEGIDKGGRGVRPMALANAFAAATDDPWMPWHNPAGIGSTSLFRSSLSLVPQQFGMTELRTISAAVVIPTSVLNVGVVLDDLGSSLYRESTAVVGVARTIESGLAVGLAANLGIVSIRRYGSASTVTLDFGVRLELDERVSLGYCWKNFGGAAIGHSGEGLPQSQTLGVRYMPHRLAQITVDLEKEVRYPFLVRAGVELHVLPQLDFRFGFSDNPEMLALGLGARMSGWECSYAVNTHPQLGLTHALGISFEILR